MLHVLLGDAAREAVRQLQDFLELPVQDDTSSSTGLGRLDEPDVPGPVHRKLDVARFEGGEDAVAGASQGRVLQYSQFRRGAREVRPRGPAPRRSGRGPVGVLEEFSPILVVEVGLRGNR